MRAWKVVGLVLFVTVFPFPMQTLSAAEPPEDNPYDRLIEVTAELAQLAEDLKAGAENVVVTQEALAVAQTNADQAVEDYNSVINAIADTLEELAEVLEDLKSPPIPPAPEE